MPLALSHSPAPPSLPPAPNIVFLSASLVECLLEALRVLLEEVVEPLGRDRLRPLEGQVKGAVPEELGEDAIGTADTKEDGIVIILE